MSRATRRRRDQEDDSPSSSSRIRVQEQLLIDAAPELPSGRLLCNTAGRGQFARSYVAAHPDSHATCWFLDVYHRDQAEREGDQVVDRSTQIVDRSTQVVDGSPDPSTGATEGLLQSSRGDLRSTEWQGQETVPQHRDLLCPSTLNPQPSTVSYACTADPPGENYDVVAWTCSARGDGELTREMLQAGHERLRMDGRFVASIDNPNDQWLHDELHKLFPKVTRLPLELGVLYLATKTARLPKVKSFDAEFAFRDEGRLIFACSRPGVFSHRHIDPGARALINTMHIERKHKVLDLGCGTGVVGLAALFRADDVRVLAVDANPRALQCAERGAKRNDLAGLETCLDATGETIPPNTFDVVCANPPYYSHYKIAELFLNIAQRALKLRGVVHVVTKTPDWFVEHMPAYFGQVDPQPVKSYWVVTGRKKTV